MTAGPLPFSRRALLGVGGMLATIAALPGRAWALVKGGGPGLELLHPFLTPLQRATLSGLADRILPSTGTPGAVAAGVPEKIEMMLWDWHSAAERAAFLDGLAALDVAARKLGKAGFAAADPAAQDVILTAMMNGELGKDSLAFFIKARDEVISAYYRSEPGAKLEQSYLPVPGDYVGDYPYNKIGRVISW